MTRLLNRFTNKSVAFPVNVGERLGMRDGLGMKPLYKLFESPDGVVCSISVQVLRLELISSEVWTLLVSDSFHCMWVVAYCNKSLESYISQNGLEGLILLLMDIKVMMKTLHTGQRVVALKNIETASYPAEFSNAFTISFEGHPYTIGNPTIIFPESMDNYSLYRSVFSHSFTAVVEVLDWELVKLGSETKEPFYMYLVRVGDKQSAMKVMCGQAKWETLLVKSHLQPGGHIVTTLHKLLKSSRDVEKLFVSCNDTEDLKELSRIYPGFEKPARVSSKRQKKKARSSKEALDKKVMKRESFVGMRLNRDVERGNIPYSRVMVMINDIIYLGKGAGGVSASLPFYRGDEGVNLDGKFLEGKFLIKKAASKECDSEPLGISGDLGDADALGAKSDMLYKPGEFTHKSLVDIFLVRDTVECLLGYLDTETVVDMLNVCKDMTSYFVSNAGEQLHYNASGILHKLFPLHNNVYKLMHEHLIMDCMCVALDKRKLYNSRSGIKYEESIGCLFFEGLDMPNGAEKMYPPSAPSLATYGGSSDEETVVYELYTNEGDEENWQVGNIFPQEPIYEIQEQVTQEYLLKNNKQFVKDLIDLRKVCTDIHSEGAREYFVRHMNVMPLVPGTFTVVADRAKIFCEELWSVSADTSKSGKTIEHIIELNYPSIKFDNACVRVNVQILREWVSPNQIVYLRYVGAVDQASVANHYYEKEGWTS